MPARETYGAQPPVELLRQFQDFRGFYDRKKLFLEGRGGVIISACAPPGGGRQEVTPRDFSALQHGLNDDAAKRRVHEDHPSCHLRRLPRRFPQGHHGSGQSPWWTRPWRCTSRSEELLWRPSPSRTTRSTLATCPRCCEGILLIKPNECKSRDVMTRLWVHESMRVFHDRLISIEDKEYFKQMVAQLVKKNFGGGGLLRGALPRARDHLRGFFHHGRGSGRSRVPECSDFEKMVKLMEDYLEEYNSSSTNTMNLVFFKDAAEHATRIARILRQPRGNAMLVGVGGSGKQSLTRFASFMAGFKCFSIELTRGYGVNEFRDDLKTLYHQTGIEGTPTVFLFTDTQIVTESFVEDINNILNSGEVPALFDQQDKDRICADN